EPGRSRSGTERVVDLDDRITLLDDLALGDQDARDVPVARRNDRDLHLHRLEDHERITGADLVALTDQDLPDVADDLGLRVDHRCSIRRIAATRRSRVSSGWMTFSM